MTRRQQLEGLIRQAIETNLANYGGEIKQREMLVERIAEVVEDLERKEANAGFA